MCWWGVCRRTCFWWRRVGCLGCRFWVTRGRSLQASVVLHAIAVDFTVRVQVSDCGDAGVGKGGGVGNSCNAFPAVDAQGVVGRGGGLGCEGGYGGDCCDHGRDRAGGYAAPAADAGLIGGAGGQPPHTPICGGPAPAPPGYLGQCERESAKVRARWPGALVGGMRDTGFCRGSFACKELLALAGACPNCVPSGKEWCAVRVSLDRVKAPFWAGLVLLAGK